MGFENCHPAVNFIFFAAVIIAGACFTHPVLLIEGLAAACVYYLKRRGAKGIKMLIAALVIGILFAAFYCSYNHFGVTILGKNFIGNNITLESVLFGLCIGLRISCVLMWLGCMHTVITADKVIYLFGKISPKLSLFISILIRMTPRVANKSKQYNTARRCIGKGVCKNAGAGWLKNLSKLISAVTTWTIEAFVTISDSMKSRGSLLKKRTAFSIYRFDMRDRALVLFMVVLMTLAFAGAFTGRTDMLYNPWIIIPETTGLSYIFFAGYLIFCLIPLIIDVKTESAFRKSTAVDTTSKAEI